MVKKNIILFLTAVILCSGCTISRWDIKQLETTFMNEETHKEFIQKNTVLLDKKTGQAWVFESDGDSNYYWQSLTVK